MTSSNGRWVVVFNGEIYNTGELRDHCGPDVRFRGHCDAEVLCELVAAVGPVEAARMCVGMFAFAAWDDQERRLHLVRDRVGVKPLYFGLQEGVFAFASELSSIRGLAEFGTIDAEGLRAYLRRGYVPGPLSILRGVSKLEPGTALEVAFDGSVFEVQKERWWSLRSIEPGSLHGAGDREAIDLVRSTLMSSVETRMVSDRPLGAFLSGGIDSTLVVSCMSRCSDVPVNTFSIGFEDALFDESTHAREVAAHLGTTHVERILSNREVLESVPGLGSVFDEPFADSSQIPMMMLCRLARQDVVVALSGDGGDELFCGYDRYDWTVRLWGMFSRIPHAARHAMSMGMAPIPPSLASIAGRMLNHVLPGRMRMRNPGDRLARMRMRELLPATNMQDLYARLGGIWHHPEDVIAPGFQTEDRQEAQDGPPVLDQHGMMLRDFEGYLPDDILVKVDRTSMHVGLEARVPMLDHRLVELARSLPLEMKTRNGIGKWVLRQILADMVPSRCWDRPKQGFGVPLGSWLRGPLRAWGEELLSEDRIRSDGYFRPDVVRGCWQRHQSGRADNGSGLWCLLMFQSWLHERSF